MTDTEKASYVNAIADAKTGPAMRAPIANALKALWKDVKAAETLGGRNASRYVSQEYFNAHSAMDPEPTYQSSNMVASGGVFAMTGDLENIGRG